MITDKRILKVIEGLTMGELEHKDPQETLDEIYTFSHLASTCENKHQDWEDKFLQVEDFLIKHGIISDIR